MKQKDLADEYAEKEYKRVNGDSVPIFTDETCFTFDDIKAAFGAGRESVVENVPELKWRKEICRDKYFLEAYALGAYYLIILRGSEFHVACNYRHFASYTSLTAAKQAAKEHYKELIKQALGV